MSWVKIRVNFQTLIHRPLTAKGLVQLQARQGENRCGKIGRRKSFSPSTLVFPVNIIQPVPHIHLRLGATLTRRINDRSLLNSKRKFFQNSGIVGCNLTFLRSAVHSGHKYAL